MTIKTKHTPGPWSYDLYKVITLAVTDKERVHGYGCENNFICDLNDGEYHEYFNQEEQNANARLISSAPELLEALKEMVSTYDGTFYPEKCEAIELAKIAISKAEGTL